MVGGGGGDHRVAMLQAEGHGLLDQDVLARVEGVNGKAVVQLMPEHHRDGIDVVVLQQLGV